MPNIEQNNFRRTGLVIYSALFLLTIAVFLRVGSCDFVHYDDPDYVTANPYVQMGLKGEAINWAFFNLHGVHTYWHPLTWLSHMLDVQLFGVNSRAHHFVNLAFHSINVMLLFTLLCRLTEKVWRSAVVAGLFAVHPLQVDTVGWVTERKNLLAGCFFLLILLAYRRYAQKPSVPKYLLVAALFSLGLMCKPVLVIVPLVLLLLDYWPLNRVGLVRSSAISTIPKETGSSSTVKLLLLEKVPLLVLSAVSAGITIEAHQQIGIFEHNRGLSAGVRLVNALVSYSRYLKKIIWPDDLAVLYPLPAHWPVLTFFLALLGFLGITALTLWKARVRPYLLVGWLWFLIILLPTSGLVQAGIQAMADRFMYLPIVGIFVAAVWTFADWTIQWQYGRAIRASVATGTIIAFSFCSWHQIGFWQNDLTLWTRALAVTSGNYLGHYDLAVTLYQAGDLDGSLEHAQEALRLKSDYSEASCLIANIFFDRGQTEEAIANYLETERLNAARADVPFHLGRIFSSLNRLSEATPQYRRALALDPENAVALNNLAWILATAADDSFRNGHEAAALAERACQLTGSNNPLMVGTLAAAYAENGEFERATRTAENARDLALRLGENDLVAKNNELLELYKSGKPYREP